MAYPRMSEQIHWSEDAAKKPDAMWGCWECGFEDSYVRDVDKDTDHIRVRLRECTRCGAKWETEEHRIGRGSFMGRAEKRRYAAFRKHRYTARTCAMCKEKYMGGQYQKHTGESPVHRKLAAKRAARVRNRERRYQRMWMRAKREIEKASRSHVECARCGGRYLEGTYRTEHAKTLRHLRVLREEANDRRRARKAA